MNSVSYPDQPSDIAQIEVSKIASRAMIIVAMISAISGFGIAALSLGIGQVKINPEQLSDDVNKRLKCVVLTLDEFPAEIVG